MRILRTVDAFINATEPFKLAKDEAKRRELEAILYRCAESVRIASLLLWPVLPERMEDLWEAMSQSITPNDGDLDALIAWGGLEAGTNVTKIALFPRVDAPA